MQGSDLEGELHCCQSSRSTALDTSTDRPAEKGCRAWWIGLLWVVLLLALAVWLLLGSLLALVQSAIGGSVLVVTTSKDPF